MGLHIFRLVDGAGRTEGAVIVDSVTEQPLSLPIIRDAEDDDTGAVELAEQFVAWTQEIDGRDPRGLTPGVLGSMWERFLRRRHDTIGGVRT